MPNVVHVQLPWSPRAYQERSHAALKRFNVLIWHRRAGKTLFASEWLVEGCATHDKTYRAAYIAPFFRQARLAAWDYLRMFCQAFPMVQVSESDFVIRLPNGGEIRIFGADNPDALRGVGWDRVVMDEVAQMRSQVWGEIVRPALMDRLGEVLFIGTPKGINLLSELYYRGADDPEWHVETLTVDDTGALPQEEVETARRTMSPAQFRQELYCDFQAACDDALVPIDLARAAISRTLDVQSYAFAPRVLGVDVARFGDDRTVLFRRQGLQALPPRVIRGESLMHVADVIATTAREWGADAILIDATGIGAGVVDRLRQLGVHVIGVEGAAKPINPAYANKRSECWVQMMQWLKDGGSLPPDEGLVAELTAPRYEYGNNGKLLLEPKDQIKTRLSRSPDLADALALTFGAAVATRSIIEQIRPPQAEYDPIFRHLGAA